MKKVRTYKPRRVSLPDRFWRFVGTPTETGCWPWLGARLPQGYGSFIVTNVDLRGVQVYAHRFSWTLHNAEDPGPRMVVMHSCDNPCCVNPAHLSIGTQLDNMGDAKRKGRVHVPPRVLDPDDVRLIRAFLSFGVGARRIGLAFGATTSTVFNIKYGHRYADTR